MVQINVLEKPIERIKKTCAMVGIAEKFDRALPDLETFLEGEVARGETRETRLTFDGLVYLRRLLGGRPNHADAERENRLRFATRRAPGIEAPFSQQTRAGRRSSVACAVASSGFGYLPRHGLKCSWLCLGRICRQLQHNGFLARHKFSQQDNRAI